MKKRWVKALAGAVVVLAALWLTILVSSVSSRNRVEAYKDQLRAAGEKLEIEELIPPRLAPEQNSVDVLRRVISLLAPGRRDVLDTNPPLAMRLIEPGKAMSGWQQPEICFWDATNSWEDVELALAAQAVPLDELRHLPDHPRFDFELDYLLGLNIPLPFLSGTKNLINPLSAAMMCALHRRDPASATTNLHTMLMLVNGLNREPLLISQLVRIAMAAITFNSQWEWLQATNVTDEHLATLQRDWTELEFVQPMEDALIMERAMMSRIYAQLRTSNAPPQRFWSPYTFAIGSGGWLDDLKQAGTAAKREIAFSLWRASWSQSDELRMLQGNQAAIEAIRQIQTNGCFKDAMAELDRQIKALGLDKADDNWFRDKLDDEMRQLLGTPASSSKALNRVLAIGIIRQLAITAIAIKRHTVRHGTPPSDLQALVPAFLPAVPRDPMDGQPLRYRLNADGTFTLYSIGEDGVDDGGDPTSTSSSRTTDLRRGRDYVWPQPATVEEIRIWEAKPASEK